MLMLEFTPVKLGKLRVVNKPAGCRRNTDIDSIVRSIFILVRCFALVFYSQEISNVTPCLSFDSAARFIHLR